MKWDDVVATIWKEHRGKVIGIGLGLLFGLFAVVIGLLKTLFIAVCVGVGYVLGKRADEQGDLKKVLERLFGD
ncbi:MAG: DUF2273 domain-containing protein [Clostridia bacterium]|nr:DUF2273 domain-containing protein [Clostridia bacterium]